MSKRVIVFDLDDTLYSEITFVYSGFRAVSRFLRSEFNLNEEEVFGALKSVLEKEGRGKVFDEVLKKYNLHTQKNIARCLSAYRLHKPEICLDEEAKKCIKRLTEKGDSLYLVTDGNKVVQYNKVKSLKLDKVMKKCFITHQYGVNKSKPSPYCFNKIAELEKAKPSDIVYIGDNPKKDFVGIKPLGFKTIRIRKGCYQNLNLDEKFEAEYCINSLNEIDDSFLNKVFSN